MGLTAVDSRIERGFDASQLVLNAISADVTDVCAAQARIIQALSASIANLTQQLPSLQPSSSQTHLDCSTTPTIPFRGLTSSSSTVAPSDACDHASGSSLSSTSQSIPKHKSNVSSDTLKDSVANATQTDVQIFTILFSMIREQWLRLDPQQHLSITQLLDRVLPLVGQIKESQQRRKLQGKKPTSFSLVTRIPLAGGAMQSEVLLDEALQHSVLQLILSGISQFMLAV
jgi:uncharacterized coiled-coil protein SlyX